jgi:2'-5' RNA ligase
MPDEILRTFIAIELDEALRTAIARVQGKFKRLAPPGSVKWVGPDGIHLTLKFLGETPASRLGAVEAALRAACADAAPFEISVEGRGCFPNMRRPRVLQCAIRGRRWRGCRPRSNAMWRRWAGPRRRAASRRT